MKKIILALTALMSMTAIAAVGPMINGNQINPQTAISISTLTVTGATGESITGAGGLTLANDVGVNWNSSANNVNCDSTRCNIVVNSGVVVNAQTTKVGILTSSPGTSFDVNGNAQFGSTGKSTFTTTGALNMASGTAITLSGAAGNLVSAASVTASAFFGNIGQTTGNAQTASALASAPSAAASGFVCRGIDVSGNCLPAAVNATTSGVSSSTQPWSAGAAFTTDALNAKLAGATFTGASGITNQSFTATGANGNIVSASSITASAFFGNGGALSGVTSSTGTLAAGYTTTQITYLQCVTASTRTIVAPVAGNVIITFSGTASNTTGTNGTGSSFLIDGGYAPGLGSSSDQGGDVSTTGGSVYNVSFPFTLPISAGTHNFCATLRATGGATTVTYNGGAFSVTLIHN